MAVPPAEYEHLPAIFGVETMYNGRAGYAYIRSNVEHTNPMNAEMVTILRPHSHSGHFYRIVSDGPYVLAHRSIWKNTLVRKGSGRVNRNMHWRNTGSALRYNGIDYPILKLTALITILPAINTNTFIPIQVEEPVRVVPPKNYLILTIPQHVVRALLRDAAMQDEVCAITGEDLDVTNGAVTTCFHLFEKNAIAKWLSMHNSQDKCPVCNAKCISYTLDDVPPPLDRTVIDV